MPVLKTKGALSAQGYGLTTAPPRNYIEDVFSTWLYTGTGASQTITNNIALSANGGMVWMKSRSAVTNHAIYDTARGATFDIASNTAAAQTTQATGLTAFGATGFTIGSLAKINTSAATYVSWTFGKQSKFFDIVTYTGTGSNRTIAHNLGSVPGCIIVSGLTNGGWAVYHRSLTSAAYQLELNTTSAELIDTTVWNSTAPTSSVFSVGTNLGVNGSGLSYVAYLFAHDAGGFGNAGTDNVISCGSYTGNSGTRNISLGYEPQWILVKNRTTDLTNWMLADNMRSMSLTQTFGLSPNTSSAESDQGDTIKINSTGFTLISSQNQWNQTSSTYIYIAIRRGPMKTPTVGTSVFVPQTRTGTTSAITVSSSVLPDTTIITNRSHVGNSWYYTQDRLRGANQVLTTNATDAESAAGGVTAFNNNSYALDSGSGTNQNPYTYVDWVFRRAPGFFDVVCYTGDGTNPRNINHGLTVPPEFMLVKRRGSTTQNWLVYHSALGAAAGLNLNLSSASQNPAFFWNSTPTSSTFSTQLAPNTSSDTYVAYLFATVAGVSKVGSYTGTAATLTVNCGFTSGARFVLIKRTDSTGDWYVWDSARGITAGNDPYLLLNSTAAEVTGTNYVDTDSTGFKVTAAAPAGLNASGGTYIFLAIA